MSEITGEDAISGSFTETERERFHNLLKLAAESPFEGERTAALGAAERLADKYGMTLDEAAVSGRAPPQRPAHEREKPSREEAQLNRFAQAMHLMDYHVHIDKARRDAALEEARRRGLDNEAAPQPRRQQRAKPLHARRMKPERHAAVLLKETQLPFREVAEITGLSIYEVVGLKLKMRTPEGDILHQEALKRAAAENAKTL